MNTLCEYGCGQEVQYILKNGKGCCSKFSNSCSRIRYKNSIAKIGKISKPYQLTKSMCLYCNKEITNRVMLRHKIACKLNPINIIKMEEQRQTLNYMCENCNNNHNGLYGSGRFCSKRCAVVFSTKNNRKDINLKIKNSLLLKNIHPDNMSITCKTCNKDVVIKWKKNPSKWCSIKCKNNDIDIKAKISKGLRVRYQDPINRKFLRDIGRKGGFGKTGYTDIGIYYQSSFEEKCFMYLDYCNIKYHSHKNIPNSTKISDIYLIDKDIWIELDGIDREKRQKWLGNDYQYWLDKLNLYKNQNLHYYVIKTFDEFIEIIIDKGV